MAALCDNLCIAWSGDYDSLKFISEDLKLDGNWEQPGSDKKVFKTDNFSVSWRKSKSLLHFEGDETRNIAQVLTGAMIVKNFDPAVNKDTNTSNSNSSCKTKSTSLLSLSGASCKCTDVHSDIQELKLSQSVNREAIQALSDSLACITHVKISQLVASPQTSCQQVVFARLVTSCQQVWNKLLTTCNKLVDIIRLVASLFQQGCYNHDITILLQPCVVNLVTFLLYHDCIRLVRTTL